MEKQITQLSQMIFWTRDARSKSKAYPKWVIYCRAPTAFHPLRQPKWEHRLWPRSRCKSDMTLMEARGKRRPHAVRIISARKLSAVNATCHIERCKAPVTSSACSSGASLGLTASCDEELKKRSWTQRSLMMPHPHHCHLLAGGASMSSGITCCSESLK